MFVGLPRGIGRRRLFCRYAAARIIMSESSTSPCFCAFDLNSGIGSVYPSRKIDRDDALPNHDCARFEATMQSDRSAPLEATRIVREVQLDRAVSAGRDECNRGLDRGHFKSTEYSWLAFGLA